jgi:serralysin
MDFNPAEDSIVLDDAVFTALRPGLLMNGEFTIGTAAQDANDRIIYDSNGSLWYDGDGAGGAAAVQFAQLANHATLSGFDILVM